MPFGGFIEAYLFTDFTFANDGGEIVPDNNGPFTLPHDATANLAAGSSTITINVSDDDEVFDDGFQDDPTNTQPNQFLMDPVMATDTNGDPVTIPAGQLLEVEWTLTATPQGGGDPIDMLFVAAGPSENGGDIMLVVTTAPLDPTVTYDIAFKNDGGGTEYGALTPAPDGVVDGEEFGEVMGLGYDDSNAPTDGGGDMITNDADIIDGNGGDDTIDAAGGDDIVFGGTGDDDIKGGTGDDTLFGGGSPSTVREVFQWNEAAGFADEHDAHGFTQDTGNVEVTFTIVNNHSTEIEWETAESNVDFIDTGTLGPVDPHSNLALETNDDDDSAKVRLDFSEPVTNVDFNINDIDFDSKVTIFAYDEHGNKTLLNITAGDGVTLSDSDGLFGADTATSNGGGEPPSADEFRINIEIPGPVSYIEIIHNNTDGDSSHVHITDVYFDALGDPGDLSGNDVIDGEEGDDTIFGEDGSDILIGGLGDDKLFGGADDDTLILGSGDTALGGGGDDIFVIDSSNTDGPGTIFIQGGETDEGGSDTTNDNYPGAPNTIGDVLDLRMLNIQSFNPAGGDPTSESGTFTYLNDEGELITVNYSEIENVIICFARGTLILTPEGERRVEELQAGDRVITRDNGFQELRWIGSRKVPAVGNLAPIRIQAGALGNNRDLMVSPQHRMLISDWRASMLFDASEVLVAAKHLVNGDTIFAQPGGEVEYFHMLFDRHEIVVANGTFSESFHPGEVGMGALDEAARAEILELFPELAKEPAAFGPAARPSLKAHEGRLLAEAG